MSEYITTKEACKIMGTLPNYTNNRLRINPNVRRKKHQSSNLWNKDDVLAVKAQRDAEEAKKWVCKCCGIRSMNDDPTLYGFCTKAPCKLERLEWAKANFDQLERGGLRSSIEQDFWEPNEIQKEKYAYFYSMVRAKKPDRVRKCMRCKASLDSRKALSPEHRMCAECHHVIDNVGALASY